MTGIRRGRTSEGLSLVLLVLYLWGDPQGCQNPVPSPFYSPPPGHCSGAHPRVNESHISVSIHLCTQYCHSDVSKGPRHIQNHSLPPELQTQISMVLKGETSMSIFLGTVRTAHLGGRSPGEIGEQIHPCRDPTLTTKCSCRQGCALQGHHLVGPSPSP